MVAKKFSGLAIAVSVAIAATTGAAFADKAVENAMKARKGQFQLLAFNVGVLGGMARGNAEYDAAQAQAAAENIQAIAALNQGAFWPEGSDSMSVDDTRAMPIIWDNFDDFASKWQAVATAAEGLPAAVSSGVAGIGPALGPIGGTCKDCHDTYRAPRD